MQDAHESGFDEIPAAVGSLGKIGRDLRLSGVLLVLVTLATVVVSLMLTATNFLHIIFVPRGIAFLLEVGTLLLSAVLAIRFESFKKRGDVLFKELSDELQWHVRFETGSDPFGKDRPPPESRPGLNTRVVLREFAQSTDLPLIPGRYGPGLYVAINLMIMVGDFILGQSAIFR